MRAGAAIVGLAHDRDGQGAHVLRIHGHGDAAALKSALERYAFKSEVLECDGADLSRGRGSAGMTSGTAAVCLGPDGAGGFMVRQFTGRRPAADEIEVAVAAASVNPIDVRRSEGYGRKLLSLLGAGEFPLILGNDLAGIVTDVGSGVSTFKAGDRVYGVKPASAEGAHASHVLVKAVHMLAAPEGRDLHALAAIPYSFTTMWLAVRGAGPYPGECRRKERAGPRRRRRPRDVDDAAADRHGPG